MCFGGASTPAPPPLPPAAPPVPTAMDPSVVKAQADVRTAAALADGRAATITNVGGAQGIDTPNPNGKKSLLGL